MTKTSVRQINVVEHNGKTLSPPRQNLENATATVCEQHGKNLKTPRQKFVDIKEKVCERHGGSGREI